MQNWILFQPVTNSDREFVSQPHKKLENMENGIDADQFCFERMKIFLIKNSSSKWKKERRRCRIEFSFNLSQIEIENLGLNCTRNWKIRKISLVQTNSSITKLKFFFSKIPAETRKSKGGDAELNFLSNCYKLRSRICVSTAQESEK